MVYISGKINPKSAFSALLVDIFVLIVGFLGLRLGLLDMSIVKIECRKQANILA